MFHQKLSIIYGLFLLLHPISSCSSGGVTGTKTYQNPNIQMKFYTPVTWTYPLSTSETDLSYFPEQPLTQITAQNNAVNDLKNAMMGSLADNQYDINLYKITVQYAAPQVNDCAKAQSNNAPIIFWIVEGGLVTKKVGGLTQAVTQQNCIEKNLQGTNGVTYEDYPMEASVKIDGLTVGEDQMNQIVNGFITKLSFNNNIKFIEEPLVS